MKQVLILFLSLLLAGCANDQTEYRLDDKEVSLKISAKTTQAELQQIADEFLEMRNILIDFSQSEFTEEGIIQNLVLKVDCQDGFSGETKASGLALKISSFGFKRNYNSDATIPFEIGQL